MDGTGEGPATGGDVIEVVVGAELALGCCSFFLRRRLAGGGADSASLLNLESMSLKSAMRLARGAEEREGRGSGEKKCVNYKNGGEDGEGSVCLGGFRGSVCVVCLAVLRWCALGTLSRSCR